MNFSFNKLGRVMPVSFRALNCVLSHKRFRPGAGVAAMCLLLATISASYGSEPQEFTEAPVTSADRDHWAFLPLTRPTVPQTTDAGWTRNAIDCFILARLDQAGLRPQPPANRVTLIRRLSFDLTGLPPTQQQVDAFVADRAPDAYERLVDHLLASPAYGQRWGQHWLDLARFAETDGYEFDHQRPHAWKYRDWVVDALNADLPYDRFVQQQLAGDLLTSEIPAAHVATGFCLAGPDMPDINSQEERRHTLLNEMTGTIASVFLALQMECAQCHDHKYDPISQADFYRLRAFFAPALHVEKKESVGFLRQADETPTSYVMLRGDWRRRGPLVHAAVPRVLQHELNAPDVTDSDQQSRLELAAWLIRDDHPLTARVIANRLWQHHFGEGLSRTPSDFGRVGQPPSHPQLLDWLATELVQREWSLKQLHRLIVTSATYRQASRVSEPGWTATERRAARQRWQQAVVEDPENELLARFPRQRLEGEAIRDAMLMAADLLSLEAGGPGVRPPLPEELVETLLKDQWNVTKERAEHYRRSVYVFARRNLRYPIFEAFDRPDANASCPRRGQSTTAPQALLMINAALSLEAAQHVAGLALEAAPHNRDEQIRLVYRRTLGRTPTPAELTEAEQFLKQQQRLLATEGRSLEQLALPVSTAPGRDLYAAAALTDLSLALLNCNEFLYVD